MAEDQDQPQAAKLYGLRFVRTNGSYVPGDVAGFPEPQFLRLVAGGFAVPEGEESQAAWDDRQGRTLLNRDNGVDVAAPPQTPHGATIEAAGQIWANKSRGQAGSLVTTTSIDPETGNPKVEVIGGGAGEIVSDAPGAGGTAAMAVNTGGGGAAGTDAGVVAPPPSSDTSAAEALGTDVGQPKSTAPQFFTSGEDTGQGGEGTGTGESTPPAATAESVAIPEDWEHLPAKDRKALASQIAGQEINTVAEGDPIIREEQTRRETGE